MKTLGRQALLRVFYFGESIRESGGPGSPVLADEKAVWLVFINIEMEHF
jgi:hypothetical protein